MADLFDLETGQKLQEGAVLLRGRALPVERTAARRHRPHRRAGAVPAHGHARRLPDVGGDDQLRQRRLGHRPHGLSLRCARSATAARRGRRCRTSSWTLARDAAADAGFAGFVPDACLINRYEPGTRLSLHQDKDERDYAHPVVSVSLGLPATFQFGGLKRSDRPSKVPLQHGDVVVWGGPSRLVYHGVLALKDGEHPTLGRRRFNLTFRKAL